jgi:hypothetical protein
VLWRASLALAALTLAPRIALGSPSLPTGLAQGELVLLSTSQTPERSLSRFVQHHRGVPVLGASVTVLEARGREIVVGRLYSALAQKQPALEASHAARIGSEQTGLTLLAESASLAMLPQPDGPRLVWRVPAASAVLSSAPVALVDAETGHVLALYDSVHQLGRAQVYPENPVTTPELADVTLALEGSASVLENEQVRALSCVDRHDVRATPLGNLHVCHVEPLARADAQGDFLYAAAADTQPEDEFAEVSLFYHTDRGLRFLTELGAPELAMRPLPVIANVMLPPGWTSGDTGLAADPSAPLEPLAGAFYRSSDPLFGGSNGLVGPALWFGQGPRTDYAYDGDVVYHELVHAFADQALVLATFMHADDQGLLDSPAALGEALADYFAAALTDDPNIGEHAARNLLPGLSAYRSLDGDARCPEHLSGEAHFDSEILSSGLWSVRSGLPEAERPALDRAVLDAMLASPSGDMAFEEWLAILVQRLELSELGASIAGRIHEQMQRRGLLPRCERVRSYAGEPLDSSDELRSASAFLAPGRYDTPWSANGRPPLLDFAPGIIQVRAGQAEGARALTVRFDVVWRRADVLGVEPTPLVVVRWGERAIRFIWGERVEADAIVSAAAISESSYWTVLDVPPSTTEAHVMVANGGDLAFGYRRLELRWDKPENAGKSHSSGGGCSCIQAALVKDRPLWPAVAALALALIRQRRRRSRRGGAAATHVTRHALQSAAPLSF